MTTINVSGIDVGTHAFLNNQNVEYVDCNYVPFENNAMGDSNVRGTFYNCHNLKTVNHINENVNNMTGTFYNCTNLVSLDKFPDKVESLTGAFEYCTSLSTVPVIPNSVNTLGSTFLNCSNLVTAPIIPEKLFSIAYCFKNCTNLKGDVYILSDSLYTASQMFYGSEKAKNVYIPFGNTSTYNVMTSSGYKTDGTVNGVYLKEDTIHFKNTDGWYYRKPDCEIIKYLGTTSNLTIPNSIDGINVTGITNFLFNNSFLNVQTLDLNNKPFRNNSAYSFLKDQYNLISVNNFNSNVTNMSRAFYNCSNLVNTPVIPNSVVDMSLTFYNCTNLVNTPVIPNSVVDMSHTFYNCRNLVNAPVIPNNVRYIGKAFCNCTNLVDAPVIPNSVTNMDGTFELCSNLKTPPVIPNNVTNISGTFYNCFNLENTPVIPNSVTDMTYTFSNCQKISDAPVIPNSVTNISETFAGCQNLTGNIYIHSENVSDAANCFAESSATKNVYIPFVYTTSGQGETLYCFINITAFERKTYYLKELPTSMDYVQYNIYDENGYQIVGYATVNRFFGTTLIALRVNDWLNGSSTMQDFWRNNSTYDIITSHNAGDPSSTYNSFINAGYSSSERVDGVMLFDINS